MLVLTRKVGQRVVVGPNIVITVVEIRGERVKLGFAAPEDIPIHREEVQQRLTEGAESSAPRWPTAESRYYAEFA